MAYAAVSMRVCTGRVLGKQEFDLIFLHLYGTVKAADKVQNETGGDFEVGHALQTTHEPALRAVVQRFAERAAGSRIGNDVGKGKRNLLLCEIYNATFEGSESAGPHARAKAPSDFTNRKLGLGTEVSAEMVMQA
jgi:hypothetical protein